jgi:hypothetical protein
MITNAEVEAEVASGFVDLGDDAAAEFALDEVHAGQVGAGRLGRGAVVLRLR